MSQQTVVQRGQEVLPIPAELQGRLRELWHEHQRAKLALARYAYSLGEVLGLDTALYWDLDIESMTLTREARDAVSG